MSSIESLGHKSLTVANWTEPDPVMASFGGIDDAGRFQSLDQESWSRHVLACELTSAVPIDIRRLHDVARGAMLYAYFFYPVMTLAAEQLYRVADAALAARMSDVPPRLTFGARIEVAVKAGVIPIQDGVRWDATRMLRNMGSHPEGQSIYAPGMALSTLEITTSQINSLFAEVG